MGLVELVSALDTPSKAIVGVLAVLGVFAFKFFPPKTSANVRLAVFGVLAALGAGAMFLLRGVAESEAPSGASANPSAPAPAPVPVSWLRLDSAVHAQSASGWAWIGRWDEGSRSWQSGPDLEGTTARPPAEGQVLTARRDLELYDDQPRFSIFSRSWSLGRRLATLGAGRRARVLAPAVVLGQNVWVRLADAS